MTRGLALAAGLALAGCNTPHNDVLVFGTSTLVGVDIKPEPENGAASIALGYRREEAVWMPLLINGEWSRFAPQAVCEGEEAGSCLQSLDDDARWRAVIDDACPAYRTAGTETAADCMARLHRLYPNRPFDGDPRYVGRSVETRTVGGRTEIRTTRDDAYSVFASVGADISAGTSNGTVGVAQFFATGLAAQALAQNDSVADALAIRDRDGQVADAERRAAEAQEQRAETAAELAGLSQDRYEALRTAVGLSEDEAARSLAEGHSTASVDNQAEAWLNEADVADLQRFLASNCPLDDTLRSSLDALSNEGGEDSLSQMKALIRSRVQDEEAQFLTPAPTNRAIFLFRYRLCEG
ncbi:hypothetical protein E5163_05320 [Marinicauda algicola]|uniref:Uncharacterized protein n=2 Tax=Marinicauda algicola TaxID=2029849 RepID=A0A4S2H5H9_9PROT|nr:hypothetical protein E5163_05320 [Marinicauda algicola]